jgi:hypothetical protein
MAAIMAEKGTEARDSSKALEWLHRYIVLSSSFNAQGAEILARLLSSRRALEIDLPEWRFVLEALEALQGEVTGPELERISVSLTTLRETKASVAAAGVSAG